VVAIHKIHHNFLPHNESRAYILDPSATGIADCGTLTGLDFIADISINCRHADEPYISGITISKELVTGVVSVAQKPVLTFTALKKNWVYGKTIFLDPIDPSYTGWVTPGRLNMMDVFEMYTFSSPAQSKIAERALLHRDIGVKSVITESGAELSNLVTLMPSDGLKMTANEETGVIQLELTDEFKKLTANGVNYFQRYQEESHNTVGCIGGACPDDYGLLSVIFDGPFIFVPIQVPRPVTDGGDEDPDDMITVGGHLGTTITLEDICSDSVIINKGGSTSADDNCATIMPDVPVGEPRIRSTFQPAPDADLHGTGGSAGSSAPPSAIAGGISLGGLSVTVDPSDIRFANVIARARVNAWITHNGRLVRVQPSDIPTLTAHLTYDGRASGTASPYPLTMVGDPAASSSYYSGQISFRVQRNPCRACAANIRLTDTTGRQYGTVQGTVSASSTGNRLTAAQLSATNRNWAHTGAQCYHDPARTLTWQATALTLQRVAGTTFTIRPGTARSGSTPVGTPQSSFAFDGCQMCAGACRTPNMGTIFLYTETPTAAVLSINGVAQPGSSVSMTLVPDVTYTVATNYLRTLRPWSPNAGGFSGTPPPISVTFTITSRFRVVECSPGEYMFELLSIS